MGFSFFEARSKHEGPRKDQFDLLLRPVLRGWTLQQQDDVLEVEHFDGLCPLEEETSAHVHLSRHTSATLWNGDD